VVDTPRSVFRTFDNGPIAMELDQFTAVDGPQKAGTCEVIKGTSAAATE
jgi:hypothetical protein